MKTPLYTALSQHAEKKPYSFHVPGHHNGDVFFDEARSYYASILQLDVTELEGLDDLHHPTGVIQEAEDLLAKLYGAKQSFFLVNGTTVGNLAMVMSACQAGEGIFVQRNCHKSVFHAIELAGATPIMLETESDPHLHVPTHVTEETVKQAMATHPNCRAIVLTYPNYYGHAADLSGLIQMCHEVGIIVLVDEAHGAHFVLGGAFPPSALSYGADVVVQSAHKTLPAMTMGSYLHLQGDRIDVKRMKTLLTMLQSSSPSYPIMASLDVARAYVEELKGKGLMDEIMRDLAKLKAQFNMISNLEVVESDFLPMDPLKCVIRSTKGLTGYELKKVLESVEVHPELADEHQVLLVFGLRQTKDIPFTAIEQALQQSDSLLVKKEPQTGSLFLEDDQQKRDVEAVPFEKAVGRISAESVIPYPPGIPLMIKGEPIESDQIATLSRLLGHQVHVQASQVIHQRKLYVYIEEETL
ncbi:aminotransferase class I/II-fold pyridoxal phosphate-dependent enzyme [Bacillus altitudinis]|uniref:aminotransferase class I/II-fold pyridoxal phosphate-dependent enzyme n=1 Tax=Bacillus altitudinis TaxID=293387 RepID=UPI002570712F|nr:aminotransferase class I/II-fold pyridoxal phosphate-dependent enzyme [Bacillus altitudinis]WJE30381.1 aminotransferase class I/II-fold pyridoxal phosphate-dependent enzyme [Bacillus altitudinis]